MKRLRLFLARLLLPRGWVVAHGSNIHTYPENMTFWIKEPRA